ncbi:MAG: phosphate acyltransferase PlsX [Myxococcota bacterium]
MVTIAVDAMGGDDAPDALVRGVALVSLDERPLSTILVGDAPELTRRLREVRHNPERIAVHHAPESIAMNEAAGDALRRKPRASVVVCAHLVREGAADAMVTAGHTGAAVLAAARHFRRLPGVRRAALAAVYPTELRRGDKEDPFSLILDVGATLDATAEDLVSFAAMGSSYAQVVSNNPRPRVALLSSGAESTKGPPEIVRAHALLNALPGIHFIGNVEGTGIPRGAADVVVCSGFLGNVVLKMLEGVGETILGLARYAGKERLLWRAGLWALASGLDRVKTLTDWQEYGGAPILGLGHVCIKAHGRSGPRAVANAVKVAAKAAAGGVPAKIAASLAQADTLQNC